MISYWSCVFSVQGKPNLGFQSKLLMSNKGKDTQTNQQYYKCHSHCIYRLADYSLFTALHRTALYCCIFTSQALKLSVVLFGPGKARMYCWGWLTDCYWVSETSAELSRVPHERHVHQTSTQTVRSSAENKLYLQEVHAKSIKYSGSRIWNALNKEIKNA